jgi:transcriptional regulator with XRE-family HTH domain
MTKEKLRIVMGKNLREERKIQGMARRELANLTNISIIHIGLIERGERGMTSFNLYLFAKKLKVSEDRFFMLQDM